MGASPQLEEVKRNFIFEALNIRQLVGSFLIKKTAFIKSPKDE